MHRDDTREWPHGYGYCYCGCGERTRIAKSDGYESAPPQRRAGKPLPFVSTAHRRTWERGRQAAAAARSAQLVRDIEAAPLHIEMLPPDAWGKNARTARPDLWPQVRRTVIRRAGGRCQVCGDASGTLHAHEQWTFTPDRQTLAGIVAICERCHDTIHAGRTGKLITQGKLPRTYGAAIIEHFCTVNRCTREHYDADRSRAWVAWEALQADTAPGGRVLDLAGLAAYIEAAQ